MKKKELQEIKFQKQQMNYSSRTTKWKETFDTFIKPMTKCIYDESDEFCDFDIVFKLYL